MKVDPRLQGKFCASHVRSMYQECFCYCNKVYSLTLGSPFYAEKNAGSFFNNSGLQHFQISGLIYSYSFVLL
ncbi:hypothetical protein Sjap_006025 [Stephania japonica]|uniref:Uncharacterized protein n=1 Tax=Stephania japonica TaxID=461633 RepID=A0AAP0PJC9_9MAGN